MRPPTRSPRSSRAIAPAGRPPGGRRRAVAGRLRRDAPRRPATRSSSAGSSCPARRPSRVAWRARAVSRPGLGPGAVRRAAARRPQRVVLPDPLPGRGRRADRRRRLLVRRWGERPALARGAQLRASAGRLRGPDAASSTATWDLPFRLSAADVRAGRPATAPGAPGRAPRTSPTWTGRSPSTPPSGASWTAVERGRRPGSRAGPMVDWLGPLTPHP